MWRRELKIMVYRAPGHAWEHRRSFPVLAVLAFRYELRLTTACVAHCCVSFPSLRPDQVRRRLPSMIFQITLDYFQNINYVIQGGETSSHHKIFATQDAELLNRV